MPDTSNFLTHEHLPLSAERWRELNMAVVESRPAPPGGRRFLDLYGPLGAGASSRCTTTFTGTERAAIGVLWRGADRPVRTAGRQMLTIPILFSRTSPSTGAIC